MSEPTKAVAVNSPSDLLAKAIESNMGVEQLEKFMDLQDRWEKKQAEKAFFLAMNQFQANKPLIIKTNSVEYNGKKKFDFASLAKIQKAIDPVLSNFGLSYTWKQSGEAGKVKITCVAKHIDGHSEETFLEGEHDTSGGKNAIQAVGSAVSYLKRYTLMNAFGLSADDDDGASTQMTPEEVDALMLEKLIKLSEEKTITDEATAIRLSHIIENKESSSYKKAIKILSEL